jgi:UDP-N-acetylmuramoylalanine--D-glutamate ligase
MIDLPHLAGRSVAVLGLGKTGLSSALALMQSGANVFAWDDGETAREAATAQGIEILDLNDSGFKGISAMVLSPGIPHSFPKPHPAVVHARDAGVRIVSDIELLIKADPQAAYIGITGTNGKSTTTALLGHVLQHAGRRVQVGGNLGPAVLGFERMGEGGVYVLELSSYQLELTPSLTPDIGILLNITPDHLDRHGGMEGYVAAKRSLFRAGPRRQTAVISIDDEHCTAIAGELIQMNQFTVITVSVTGHSATLTVTDGILTDTRTGETLDLTRFSALPGLHNWQNAACVYGTAQAMGVGLPAIASAFASFPGLAHRQQRIAEIDGVTWINDSKATNADSVEKALSCYDNIHWIAGGLPKEGGLNGLEPLMRRIRHAYLIGKAEDEFAAWLAGRAPFMKCGTLDRAVAAARQNAKPGSVVLLSPACASWDQFTSFEHRGEVFTALVREIAKTGVAA